MSKPSRPVSGFVPIGELAGTLPGIVPRRRAMSAETRHHFTTLRQVNQLIEASEADADMGFMARLLALCSLPRTNPKQRNQYVRRNGPYALYMTAGAGNRLPFGNLATPGCQGRALTAAHRAGLAANQPGPVALNTHQPYRAQWRGCRTR